MHDSLEYREISIFMSKAATLDNNNNMTVWTWAGRTLIFP